MFRRDCKPSFFQSFFIFGPRGTGKSTLINDLLRQFPATEIMHIDLLLNDVDFAYRDRPMLLKEQLEAMTIKPKWVFIDEIQKAPDLLDIVHHLIENKNINFILSGSSARKLKRVGVNLLAGRAVEFKLHPFTSNELQEAFDLHHTLHFGTLPKIFSLPNEIEKKRFLRAYTNVYLREEIQQEQIVRNIDSFRAFLEVAAQTNGEILNYAKIARTAKVEEKNVSRYFEILRDTLVGFYLEPFNQSVRKQQSHKPKFYLFDLGVTRTLSKMLDVPLVAGNYGYGKSFEHFIVLEFIRRNDYLECDYSFSYLRTKDGVEIDLIIQRPGKKIVLAEIKSTTQVGDDHCRALRSTVDFFKDAERIVISQEKMARKLEDGILVLPWSEALIHVFS